MAREADGDKNAQNERNDEGGSQKKRRSQAGFRCATKKGSPTYGLGFCCHRCGGGRLLIIKLPLPLPLLLLLLGC